jgi:hypothetical protein
VRRVRVRFDVRRVHHRLALNVLRFGAPAVAVVLMLTAWAVVRIADFVEHPPEDLLVVTPEKVLAALVLLGLPCVGVGAGVLLRRGPDPGPVGDADEVLLGGAGDDLSLDRPPPDDRRR